MPNLPKGDWAKRLLDRLVLNNDTLVYSDIVVLELRLSGYPNHEIEGVLQKIKPVLLYVESTERQVRKARDLSQRRKIPRADALHAIIARDHKALLVTLDRHFNELLDITKPRRPQDLI